MAERPSHCRRRIGHLTVTHWPLWYLAVSHVASSMGGALVDTVSLHNDAAVLPCAAVVVAVADLAGVGPSHICVAPPRSSRVGRIQQLLVSCSPRRRVVPAPKGRHKQRSNEASTCNKEPRVAHATESPRWHTQGRAHCGSRNRAPALAPALAFMPPQKPRVAQGAEKHHLGYAQEVPQESSLTSLTPVTSQRTAKYH